MPTAAPSPATGSRSERDVFDYGASYDQLAEINVPAAHEAGFSGAGVIVAVGIGLAKGSLVGSELAPRNGLPSATTSVIVAPARATMAIGRLSDARNDFSRPRGPGSGSMDGSDGSCRSDGFMSYRLFEMR